MRQLELKVVVSCLVLLYTNTHTHGKREREREPAREEREREREFIMIANCREMNNKLLREQLIHIIIHVKILLYVCSIHILYVCRYIQYIHTVLGVYIHFIDTV